MTLQLEESWTFEDALRSISSHYPVPSQILGPQRNRQIEAWGQLVGRARAIAEFDEAVRRFGSRTRLGREMQMSTKTLRELRAFYESLPTKRSSRLYPGKVLGDWRLLKPLGSGASSDVWRARRQKGREEERAIKCLRGRGKYLRKRFEAEIEILSQLGKIPGILPLLDSCAAGTSKDHTWLVVPIAEPVDANPAQPKPIDQVLRGISQVAGTLSSLHAKDIAHRDVKPSNIFIWRGKWVIGDFGIATMPSVRGLTASGRKLGPMFYIAPEMLNDAVNSSGRAADVYSLAKTLWVLLTNQTYPLPGEQLVDQRLFRIGTWVSIDQNMETELNHLLHSATKMEVSKRIDMQEFAGVLSKLKNRL